MSDYRGKPNHPMPAPQFDLFIKAFEKFVAERQKEVAKADRLMRPYEVVRAALEGARLPNDTILSLSANSINVGITITGDDRPGPFRDLIKAIGAGLVEAQLHSDGTPSTSEGTRYWHYSWRLVAMDMYSPPAIEVRLDMPAKSGKHITVTKEEKKQTYIDTIYNVTWDDKAALEVNDDEDYEF